MATPSNIPLRQVALTEWSAAPVDAALRERPLLVQIKRAARAERVIVFVHGLSSGAPTWLPMLSVAFGAPQLEAFDFALFNYQTSVISRLIPFQRLPSPEDWAGVLANAIQNTLLTQLGYESFVLVAHSMGGLVSKFAFRSMMENDAPAAKHLHSLFTYGTPNHGSDRASAFGSLLSPDLSYLRQFSGPLTSLQKFWSTRISAAPATPGKMTVHERAVVSVKDYWVSPASGISALPAEYVLQIASSHTALITPSDADDPRFRFFIDQLHAIGKQSECSLIEVQNGPRAADFLGEDSGTKLAKHLFEALLVLDAGSDDGVAKGDQFGLYDKAAEVRDQGGRLIDRLPSGMNMVEALEVKERVSYCKLSNLAYGPAFDRFQKAMDALGSEEDRTIDDDDLRPLLLVLYGRRAVRIPRADSNARERLEDAYARVLDEEKGTPAREKALRALLLDSREFLTERPFSLLADGAAFHEAWSTMELGRFEEAQALFERFTEKYPLSLSVDGARNWIAEIRLRIAVKDSGNSPDASFELADFLMREERNEDEAFELAFNAYLRKPALLAGMGPGMRFVVVSLGVLRRLPGLEVDSPETAVGLIEKYRDDQAWRDQTRAALNAADPRERAALLINLLDVTSKEFQRS